MPSAKRESLRQLWRYHVLSALEGDHPRIGRSIVFFLQCLIVLSVISIGVETLPGLPGWAKEALAYEEMIVVSIFTIEYAARAFFAPRPLRYVFSFWGTVDLAAILPFYLALGLDLRSARALRLLRLFRLFKLGRYSAAADRIAAALRSVSEELLVFGLAASVLLYVCAIFIHYFEHDAQPEAFASVFHSMWWAAVTLTTVGYGDVYPVTVGGRIFTVVMLFLALGIIAVPTGLIASALARLRRKADKVDGPHP